MPEIRTRGLNRGLLSNDRSNPVPFFSRLGVIHGISLTGLVLLAMTAITYQQLTEAFREVQRGAVDKGRAIATALTPLVLRQLPDRDELKRYFDRIELANDIDYIQVIDASGKIIVASEVRPGQRSPVVLDSAWLNQFRDNDKLDAYAVAVPWAKNQSGVDVYVALLPDPDKAKTTDIRSANHLRIGVNFDDVLQKDMPRVMWRMVGYSIVIALIMLVGLLMLLQYVLRPLKELHRGLRAVAGGDLNYQVPVFSQDEVGRLVQAFNATIARLRFAFEQIEQLATRDPLTGMLNRRIFDERLSLETARSRRYGHPFGLILVDLDHFKKINDTYGHSVGDEVLKAIGKTIEATIRETDMVARIGGEEFAVILPESQGTEVYAVAEKLRSTVADLRFKPGEGGGGLPPGLRLTISCGGACAFGRLVTPETLYTAADTALYRSKAEGRDRVTMAPRVAGNSGILKGVDGSQ